MAPSNLSKRQTSNDYYDDYGWWYSPTAYAIKWGVITAIVVFFIVFLIGGSIHARRRMKKGKMPLRYHRWLTTRRQRRAFMDANPQYRTQFPNYAPPRGPVVYTPSGPAYQMNNYGPPPPAYHEPDYVPAYAPPQGSTKVDPDQHYAAPPPGAPSYAGGSGPSQPQRAADPYYR